MTTSIFQDLKSAFTMNLGTLALTALTALIPLSKSSACSDGSCSTGDAVKLNFNADVQATVASDGTVSQKITVNNIPPSIPSLVTAQSGVSDPGVGTANTGDGHMDIFPEIVYTGTCEPTVTHPADCPCVSKAYFWTGNTCSLTLELRIQHYDAQLHQWVYGDWTEGGSLDVTSALNDTVTFQVRLHKKSDDTSGGGDSASDGGGGGDGTTVSLPSIPADSQNAAPDLNGQPMGMIPAGLNSTCPLGSTPQSGGFNSGSLALQGPISTSLANIANLTIRDPDINSLRVYRSGPGDQIQVRNSVRLADVLAIAGGGFEISLYEAGAFSPNALDPDKSDVVTAARSKKVRYENIGGIAGVHLGGVKVTTTGPNGVDHVKEVVNLAGGGVRVSTEAGLQVEDTISMFLYDDNNARWERTDVTTVTRDGFLFSKTERTWLYQYRVDGSTGLMVENQEFLLEEKVNYFNSDNKRLVTTRVPDPVFLGRARSVMKPDGSSDAYNYYTGAEENGDPSWRGLLKETLRPWNGQAFDPASATSANSESTVLTYDMPSATSDVVGPGHRIIGKTTCEPGGTVRIRDWARAGDLATFDNLVSLLGNAGLAVAWQPGTARIRQESSIEYASASEGIPSTSLTYLSAPAPGCPWVGASFASLDAEGNGYVTGYEFGHFTNGSFTANDPSAIPQPWSDVRSITVKVAAYGAPAASEATREIVIRDFRGRPYLRTLSIKSGTSWSDATTTTYAYDYWADGSVKEVTASQDGRMISHHKALFIGGVLNMVAWDGLGTETATVSDALGRIASVTRVGAGAGAYNDAQPDIVTNYEYRGRAVTSKVSAGGLWRTEVSIADLAGRTITQRDASGAVTGTTYSADGLITLTTLPGGLTRQVVRDISGRTVSITGTAVVNEYYGYSWDNTGNLVTTRHLGDPQSPRRTITVQDWAGRTLGTTTPDPAGGNDVSTVMSYASNTSRLVSSAGPSGTRVFTKPSALSSTAYTGYKASGSGDLDPASNDRVTETGDYYSLEDGLWWEVSVSKAYDTGNSAVTSITKRCLYGLPGGFATKTISISPTGGATTVTTAVDPDSKTVTRTETSDSMTNSAATVIVNGLTVAQTGHDHTTPARWYYNPLGQPVMEVSPRGAVTRKSYDPVSGALASVTDPWGNTTRYAYYGANTAAAGKLSQVTNPSGGTTTYQYSALGQVTQEAGTATYKVTYVYNGYGEKVEMRTFRYNNPSGDLTQWSYDPATGVLLGKTDAGNNTVNYTYDSAGRIHTRTWARNVTTTYSYNDLGDLTGITYSANSGTPNVTFSGHDRLGRPTSITQAGTGSESLSYLAGTGAMNARYYSGDHPLLPGIGIRYGSPDPAGRPTGFDETADSDNATPTVSRTVGYSYHNAVNNTDSLLLQTVTDSGSGSYGYSYYPDSSLVASVQGFSNGAVRFLQSGYYDIPGRLIGIRSDRMAGTAVAANISYHAYAYDQLGRRIKNTFQDGSSWIYGYNDRSEVLSATRMKPGGVITNSDDRITQLSTAYTYDGMGNRLTSTSAVLGDHTYTPDSLNRYANIITGNSRTAIGRAPAEWTVQVAAGGGEAVEATRIGEIFFRPLTASNGEAPVWQDVVIKRDSGTPSMTSHFWYAKQSVTPQYDSDGNLTNDGRWAYTWDAENRLIQMETTIAATGVGHPYVKIVYAYDWMGRMIARHVWKGGTADTSAFLSSSRWLCDGWNVIAEFSAGAPDSTTLTRTGAFTWGLDLSGTLQGAGGVGGLLACANSSALFYPSFDGNGNIVAWTASDGTAPVARREYDAFGNALVSEGAAPCSFGFSTKMQDPETGLYYYGYRWYDPLTGRWPSRDPIGEEAFLRQYVSGKSSSVLARSRREALKPLYLFNRNNPIFYVDPTGLTCIASISVMFYNSSVVSDATVNGQTDLSSGRQFSGALRAYDKDGQDVLGASVVSGGNRDPHSSVDQGDDTPIPSGSFSVGTAIPSGKIGFPVSGTAPRSGIEIHYNGVTTGCIAMVDNWDLFVQSMKETNEQCCKKSIPLSVWYNMSDGTSLPHGNSGHGHGDTGGRPGLWPEIEP